METSLQTNTWSHLLTRPSRSRRLRVSTATRDGRSQRGRSSEVWSSAAEILARCSRSRSKSRLSGSSRRLRSAALQQLAAAARLSSTAHHRLPRRAIGQKGPSPPAFRRTGQRGVSRGHISLSAGLIHSLEPP